MIAHVNHVLGSGSKVSDELSPDHARVNYYHTRSEDDPFSNSFLLHSVDKEQEKKINRATQDHFNSAEEKGIRIAHEKRFQDMFLQRIKIFGVGFSVGPPAKLSTLKIGLLSEAQLSRVPLRKYS